MCQGMGYILCIVTSYTTKSFNIACLQKSIGIDQRSTLELTNQNSHRCAEEVLRYFRQKDGVLMFKYLLLKMNLNKRKII